MFPVHAMLVPYVTLWVWFQFIMLCQLDAILGPSYLMASYDEFYLVAGFI